MSISGLFSLGLFCGGLFCPGLFWVGLVACPGLVSIRTIKRGLKWLSLGTGRGRVSGGEAVQAVVTGRC